MRTRTLPLLLAIAPLLACSSMPLFPRDGGSSLNLATEAHVKDVEEEILQRELPRRLDSMLAADRRNIAALQEGSASQGEQLEGLNTQVSDVSAAVAALAEDVRRQAESFGAVAAALQQTSSRLDTAIATLPTETLREFSKAIELYLAEREAALAKQQAAAPTPRAPAREESEEEDVAAPPPPEQARADTEPAAEE